MLSSPPGGVGLDFARVYDRVAGLLEGRGFPHAVVGALGLHAHGHSRATFDLDVLTVSAAQAPLVAFLEALGYETLHVSAGYSNHQHAGADWGGVEGYFEKAGMLNGMSGSSRRSELDLERGVPTTPGDVEALRRVRERRRLGTEDYLRALAFLPPPSPEAVERRRRAGGAEPFRLGGA